MTAGTRCRAPVERSVTRTPRLVRLPVRKSASLRRDLAAPFTANKIDPTDTVMPKVACRNHNSPRSSAACQSRGARRLTGRASDYAFLKRQPYIMRP